MIVIMNHTEWAKKYKKRVAREFIRRIPNAPSELHSGIFTAGLPGAGKTEFTVELLKNIENKPLRIDMDEIAQLIEGYRPEVADKFRGGASIILSKIYDEVLKARLDFVYDGTFGHSHALENLQRALDKGYTIKVFYIHQDPLIAWRFTKDRELVERRRIDRNGFIDTYFSLQNNLQRLCNEYKDVTISLIIKDGRNKEGLRIEPVQNVFEHIPKTLERSEIENAILE